MTMTTSAMVSSSSNFTSLTDELMLVVRSVRMLTLMPAGSVASNCGRSALMFLTTVMVFAPGWRCTLRITAGVRFIHAAWPSFSTPSTIFATSVSITGAPLRKATTTLRVVFARDELVVGVDLEILLWVRRSCPSRR